MNKRGLVIGLLVMLAVITSGFTYAFWASSVADADQSVPGTVTIGEGGATTVVVAFGSVDAVDLVPATVGANNTAVLTFNVNWNEDLPDTASASGTLAVSIESFTLGTLSETDIETMFSIEVSTGNGAAISVEGGQVVVTITVIFENEPATQLMYAQVANGELEITVNFVVTPNA
jgi:hypothetical protein